MRRLAGAVLVMLAATACPSSKDPPPFAATYAPVPPYVDAAKVRLSDIETIIVHPCPEGPQMIFSTRSYGSATAPLSLIRKHIPIPLPRDTGSDCRADTGETMRIILRGNAGELTYGPIETPASIERLRLKMLDVSGSWRSKGTYPKPSN